MRKNLFDIIENSQIDLYKEYTRVKKLFSDKYIYVVRTQYTIEEYIDKYLFINWKHRKTCLSLTDFYNSFDIPRDIYSDDKKEILLYFEFVFNMSVLAFTIEEFQQTVKIIFSNIKQTLDAVNCKIYEENDKYTIVEKSEIVTNAASKYPDTASKIIEYKSISLQGKLHRKKELLTSIAAKFEAVRCSLKQNGYKDLQDDVGFLLNNLNIRHNNEDAIKKLSATELETWYDKTYDLMLLALLSLEHINVKNDIAKLKTIL